MDKTLKEKKSLWREWRDEKNIAEVCLFKALDLYKALMAEKNPELKKQFEKDYQACLRNAEKHSKQQIALKYKLLGRLAGGCVLFAVIAYFFG